MLDARIQQIERRNLLASFFITLLIGLAYQEMIPPVRESIRADGITWGTFALFSVFFMTSIRFFIGNQLHLLSPSLVRMTGLVWLYDVILIITQSILFIFLGGVTSINQNSKATFGFVEILLALYFIDVLWVVSQWVLGQLFSKWKRVFIPWAWAILNISLVIVIALLNFTIENIYSTTGLILLLLVNLLAFIVDVILIDHYDAL